MKGSAANVADAGTIRLPLVRAFGVVPAHRFTDRFLATEWSDVIDAGRLTTCESYRDVACLGPRRDSASRSG